MPELMRWFRRTRAPDICALTLAPANDIVVDADGMRSTGSDPYFLLIPPAAGFPQGRCEFVFEALAGTVPLQPVLYLDTGVDFNEGQSIRLAGGGAGRYRQLVTLPAGLVRLRFDPTSLSGPLPLHDVSLVPRPMPASTASGEYTRWIAEYDTLDDEDRAQIVRHIGQMRQRPTFAVRVAPADDPAAFRRTADSLHHQLYRDWLGQLPEGCSVPALRRDRWRRDEPGGDFVLLLRSGDVLAPHALYRLAVEVAAHPDTALVTFDEDRLNPVTGERKAPRFRGAWSPDLVRGGDLPGAVLIRRDAMTGMPGGLRELADRLPREVIRHVAGVLMHRTGPPEPIPADTTHYDLPAPPPLVSVIIPTRDGLALLRRTLDGVLHRTAYPHLEVIVVDNGSEDPAAIDYLAGLAADERVRVLPAPGAFNYSGLNNAGVEIARGEVIALLNNDMDVIEPGWLAEMVSHALRPEVGAVGCKLLYPDGTVQHAGIVTGLTGLAGHVFRHRDGAALPSRTHNVSAVTGACLVMRRDRYLSVGGLDAVDLAVSYSDVDLCLKLDRAGLLIVWTPFASLHHLESVTRGADARPENTARAQREHDVLLRRWGERLLRDPFYSPCLSIDDEGGNLAWPPRITAPWRDY